MEIGQGRTSVNDWQNYRENGIYVDIDTSHCRFSDTPHYLTTLEGSSTHWIADGVSSIYTPSPTRFRIYLMWTSPDVPMAYQPLRRDFAIQNGWYVKWTGILT